MKITVTFDLDIDEKEWADQFPADMDDLPTAVTVYAEHVVTGLFYDLALARDPKDLVAGKIDV